MRTHPGPGADDFDPDSHLWEDGEWWTKNHEFWWDGARWRHRSEPRVGYVAAPPAPGKQPRRPGWWRDFWLGFVGVIAANIVLFVVINSVLSGGMDPGVVQFVLAVPWLLNFGGLILFAIIRPPVALGMLLAYGIAFGLAILAGIFLFVVCFSSGGGVP